MAKNYFSHLKARPMYTPAASTEPAQNNQQGRVGDLVDAGQAGLFTALGGMFDFIGADNLAKSMYGKSDEQYAEMSDRGREALSKSFVQEDEQGNFTFGEGATDLDSWLLNMANVAGQFAGTAVPGAGWASGAVKVLSLGAKGKKVANIASMGATGGAAATGQGMEQARQEIQNMPDTLLAESPLFSEVLRGVHVNQPELSNTEKWAAAKKALANKVAQEVRTDPKVLIANFGASAIGDPIIGKALTGARLAKSGALRSALAGFVTEGSTEAVQAGVQQLGVNQALQSVDGRDEMKGVVVAGLNEGLVGGGFGAAAGGFGGLLNRNPNTPQPEATPDAAPEVTPEVTPQADPDPVTEQMTASNPSVGEAMQAMDQHSTNVQSDVENLDIPTAARQAGFTTSAGAGQFGDFLNGPSQESIQSMRNQSIADMVNDAINNMGPTPQDRFSPIKYQHEGELLTPSDSTEIQRAAQPNAQIDSGFIDGQTVAPQSLLPTQQQTQSRQAFERVQADFNNQPAQIENKGIIFGEDGRPRQQAAERVKQAGKDSQNLLPQKDIIFAGNESGVNVARNGKPFKSKKEAMNSKLARQAKRQGLTVAAVPFDKGYGWTIESDAVESAPISAPNTAPDLAPNVNDTGVADIAQQLNTNQQAPTTTTGKTEKLYTPSNDEIDVEYQLVDVNDLVASNDIAGNVNANYPQELQPRDRSRASSQAQIASIANNIKPDRLGKSTETDRGAPIAKNGIVESGNGRTIAIKEAYRTGKAEAYKQYLKDNAAEFGLTPEQIENIKSPILIRNRLTELTPQQRKAFTADSNRSAGIEQSPVEQADSDANLLTADDLQLLNVPESGSVIARENQSFLYQFAKKLGDNESSKYRQKDGSWNSQFAARVNNAIFARAYKDPTLLSQLSESTNVESKNLVSALLSGAPKVAALNTGDNSVGDATGEALSETLSSAAQMVMKARRDNVSLADLISQTDLVNGQEPAEVESLAAVLNANIRSAKKMSAIINDIADQLTTAINNSEQPDIFTGEVASIPTVDEVINNVTGQNQTQPAQDSGANVPRSEEAGRQESTASSMESNDSQGSESVESNNSEIPDSSTPPKKRKVYGWDSVELSKNYTANELDQWIKDLAADPENKNQSGGIDLYDKSTMKKIDKLSSAVMFLQQQGKENNQVSEVEANRIEQEEARKKDEDKKAKLSDVIRQASDQTLTDADKVPATSQATVKQAPIESGLDAYDNMTDAINKGELNSVAEVKRVLDYLAGNESSVKAELKKLNKKQLTKLVSGHVWSDTKKAELVNSAYRDMFTRFRFIGNSNSFISSTSYKLEDKISDAKKHVDSLTDEQVAEYSQEQKAKVDEQKERFEKYIDKLRNPETLEDYKAKIKVQGQDSLTTEQQAEYDKLIAQETIATKNERPTEKQGLNSDGNVELGEPVEGVHGKTGEKIFNVNVISRLGKDAFKEAAAFARSMGGGYYRSNFYFKSVEDAELFSGWVNGETVDTTEMQAKKSEQRNAKNKERLEALAEKAEQQANEALNADRKTNTVKRLNESQAAMDRAEKELEISKLMREIPSSDTVVIKNATQKVQVELLDQLSRSLVNAAPEAQVNKDSNSRRTFKEGITNAEKAKHARMPLKKARAFRLKELAGKMLDTKGFVLTGRKINALAKGKADSDMINVSDSILPKYIDFIQGHASQYDMLRDEVANYKRLERMGISNEPTLRTALVEYMNLRDQSVTTKPKSKLSKMEQDLQRTMLGNRNAFNDFFPTPESIAESIADMADIEPGMKVLEPSAGNGLLADAAQEKGASVDVVEMAGQLREILQEKGYNLVGDDFLDVEASPSYDRIIMNPPFSNDQDIKHVEHAYKMLKPGGKLVAITSSMAGERSNKANKAFDDWLNDLEAEQQSLPEGAFKSSLNPTGVRTKVIVIEKPSVEGSEEKSDVKFSKSKTKKKAKGVSADQAQQIADDFIDSLNGANGIKVKILGTTAEAERMWRMSLNGATVKGAYSEMSNTVYVIAENIDSMTDLRQTLSHETIAHGGLDTVIGKDAHKAFIERIKKTKGRKAFEKYWKDANNDYWDMSDDVKAEEIFARFVESEPSKGELKYWWNALKRFIRAQLDKLGIVYREDDELTAMRDMLESIVKGFKAQREPASKKPSELAYSQSGKKLSKNDDFKKWFGNSKVVNSKGDPLVVYHGTGAKFESFDKSKLGSLTNAKSAELGFFFTSNKSMAYSFQEEAEHAAMKSEAILAELDKLPAQKRIDLFDDLDMGQHHGYLEYASKEEKAEIISDAMSDIAETLEQDTREHPADRSSYLPTVKKYLGKGFFDTGEIKENYLKIENPLVIQFSEGSFEDSVVTEAIKKAATNGNDGVIFKDMIDGIAKDDKGNGFDHEGDVYVALNPQQIKTASNIKFSRENNNDTRTSKQKLGLEEEAAQTLSDIAKQKLSSTLETLKSAPFWNRINEGIFDGLAGIKNAEVAAGVTDPNQQGYVSARLASGLADVLHGVFNYGAPQWRDGIVQRKEGTKGLLEVFGMVGDDLNNWLAWMGAHRAEQLKAAGKENNLTDGDIDELKALANGKEALFERTRLEYNKVNSAILDMAQEAGLLNEAQRSAFDEEYYVPFFRDMGETDPEMDDIKRMIVEPHTRKGIAGQSAQIKKLKGGAQSTKDLLENIIARQSTLIDASLKNKAMREVVNNLDGTDYITREDSDEAAARTQQQLNNDKKVKVMVDGRPQAYLVSDPALLRALIQVNDVGSRSLFNKMGRSAKRFLTAGITLSPDFIFKNFVRDAAHAWMINKDDFKFGSDSINGLKKAFKEDEAYRDLIFSGAAFQGGYIHGADPEAGAQQIRRALRSKGLSSSEISSYLGTVVNSGAELLEKYRGISDKVENANRLSTYEAAIAAGKSKRQAAFEAKDLMDYSLKGNYALIGTMIDMLPFFNARLQGMSKLARAAKAGEGDRVLKVLSANLAMKGIKVAGFSLALAAMNDDDERYQELPDWDKDMNWHFFAGEEHLRLPKPFELGIIFGTLPERMLHTATGTQTGNDLGKAVANAVINTLALNPIPQFALPATEVLVNKSFFKDAPIEGMADENKQAQDRYNAYTSDTAKAIAQTFGVSPKKVEHLIKGYTGTIGGYVLGASDIVARQIMGKETADTPVSRYPIVKAFYQGSGPKGSTKFANEFYDSLEAANQAYGSYKRAMEEGNTDRQQAILESDGDKLRTRIALGRVQRAASKLGKMARAVNDDPNLTGKQKRTQLDDIQRQKNALYHQAYVTFNLREW